MATPDPTLGRLLDLIVPGARAELIADRIDRSVLDDALAAAAEDPETWVRDAAEQRAPAFVLLRELAWEAYLREPAGLVAFGAPLHPKGRP